MSKPQKAYKNLDFLNSPAARHVRIMCEYEEPRARFHKEGVRDTIVIFGSARVKPREVAAQLLAEAQAGGDAVAIRRAEQGLRLSRYYEDSRELARRLTEWSMSRDRKLRKYLICTGGGPGIMEAANRGAADVAGGRTVGLGISLPFEENVNRWVDPDLAFEFHYFFMRKYWFAYLAKAMVIMPGGYGTLDEMAEILTLRQTKKITKKLPMVLFGSEFWNEVLDIEALIRWGTISEADRELMHHSDSVDDAFDFLTNALETIEKEHAK
ncbi:MAG: LOG family protein [Deltaproteobacteria bacterium]|nr:LOG family protein [Deltaproteobacteria bacterium]